MAIDNDLIAKIRYEQQQIDNVKCNILQELVEKGGGISCITWYFMAINSDLIAEIRYEQHQIDNVKNKKTRAV